MRLVALVLVAACGNSPGAGPPIDSSGDDGATPDGDPAIDAADPDAPIELCPANTWCTEDSPVAGTLLFDAWAVSPTDVFVVGDGGTILRRQNGAWTQMTSGTTENLRGVWATNSNDAWAVGEGGAVLRWNGQAWSAVAGFTQDMGAVWGAATNDVWLTAFGTAFHYNGSTFTPHSLAGSLSELSGTASNDVWLTGETSRVRHFTTAWSGSSEPIANAANGSTWFAVGAVGPNDAWVAGAGTTFHWNGMAWSQVAAPSATFQQFHVKATDDIWAAGGSRVGHWNGQQWTIESPANGVQFFGATGAGTHVWVVGTSSTILHRL